MDHFHGMRLKEIIEKNPNGIFFEDIEGIILPICSILLEIHKSKNVFHRNISPENILISEEGEVALDDIETSIHDFSPKITKIDHNSEPYRYIAPEQLEDNSAPDERVDVYSLGMLIYQLVSGKLPEKEEPKSWGKIEFGGVELENFIMGCIKINPIERPQSITIFRRKFEDIIKNIKDKPLESLRSSHSEINCLIRPREIRNEEITIYNNGEKIEVGVRPIDFWLRCEEVIQNGKRHIIKLTIDTTHLSGREYKGYVRIKDGRLGSLEIPVNVKIETPPCIEVELPTIKDGYIIDFGEVKKGERKTKIFWITNDGGEKLTVRITTDQRWIKITPSDFKLGANQSEIIEISVLPKKAEGKKHEVLISSNDPEHPQKKVEVAIDIKEKERKERWKTVMRFIPLFLMVLLIGSLGTGGPYLISSECSKKDLAIAVDISESISKGTQEMIRQELPEFIRNQRFKDKDRYIFIKFSDHPPILAMDKPPTLLNIILQKTTNIDELIEKNLKPTKNRKTDLFHAESMAMEELDNLQKDSFIKDRRQYFLLVTDNKLITNGKLDSYIPECPFREPNSKEFQNFLQLARRLKTIKNVEQSEGIKFMLFEYKKETNNIPDEISGQVQEYEKYFKDPNISKED